MNPGPNKYRSSCRLLPRLVSGVAAILLALPTPGRAENWPSFRGKQAGGIEDSGHAAVEWDVPAGRGVKWKTKIPGLGLSSPVVWGDKVFITTAVPETGDSALKIGLYGDIESAEDSKVKHEWKLLCLDKATGRILWEKVAFQGVPAAPRHPKSSYANCTPCTDGVFIACFFGGNGLYVYDFDANLKWEKNFGPLRTGYYRVPDAQWGFASSPVLHDGRLIIQCDVLENGFLAAYEWETGRELWKVARKDVPTFSTPTVVKVGDHWQVLVNGYHNAGGYDFLTGKSLWTLGGGGDIPVPAPIEKDGLAFFTSAHGALAPVTAVRLAKASGDVTEAPPDGSAGSALAWRQDRRGNYMQTPLAYRDRLWCCHDMGVLSCYKLTTGELVYSERLFDQATGFTASGVAADGHLYFPAERGTVVVVKAADNFQAVARNPLGAPCMASPAISDGVLFFRTKGELIAIERRP